MTTVYGMHPTFFGRRSKIFIISDPYRVITETVKVHTDIERSFLKSIRPILPQFFTAKFNSAGWDNFRTQLFTSFEKEEKMIN